MILVTPKNYRSLKTTYDTEKHNPEFIWKDKVIQTDYAKHILVHMRNVLGIEEDSDA